MSLYHNKIVYIIYNFIYNFTSGVNACGNFLGETSFSDRGKKAAIKENPQKFSATRYKNSI